VGTRIAGRVQRVKGAIAERRLRATVDLVAATVGVDPDELLTETRRLVREAWAHGLSPDAFVARETGMTVEQVRTAAAARLAEGGENRP
jgi:hypothetical protein